MNEETTPQKDLYRSGARVKCVRLRPLPYRAGARQAALVQKVINNSTLQMFYPMERASVRVRPEKRKTKST